MLETNFQFSTTYCETDPTSKMAKVIVNYRQKTKEERRERRVIKLQPVQRQHVIVEEIWQLLEKYIHEPANEAKTKAQNEHYSSTCKKKK